MEMEKNMDNKYTLSIKVNDGKIHCLISGGSGKEEYAFYLKKNDIRVETRWYTSNNEHMFEVEKDSEYQVIGFIRKALDKVIILESDGILNKGVKKVSEKYDFSEKTISIFGSCVSRDLFEFDKQKSFKIKKYFARCSVISAVADAIDIDIDNIKLDSPFQKRQVVADFRKEIWDEFSVTPSDYLMIDFIDERFDIGKYKDSYFTISNEFRMSHFPDNYETIKRQVVAGEFYLGGKKISEFLDEFIEQICQYYSAEKIILHKAKMSYYYLTKKKYLKKFSPTYLKFNKEFNQLLDYMYSYIEKKLIGCISVDCSKDCYADENHKWGLAPMHYEKNYYVRILNDLYQKIEAK